MGQVCSKEDELVGWNLEGTKLIFFYVRKLQTFRFLQV